MKIMPLWINCARINKRLIGLFLCAASVLGVFGQEIQPSAVAQIQSLLNEKVARQGNQTKLSSGLLYLSYQMRGDQLFSSLPKFQVGRVDETSQGILVDVRAQISPQLLDSIRQAGGEIINSHAAFKAVRARIPLDAILELAARDDVQFVQEASMMMVQGNVVTEGDVAHRTDVARTSFGVDGTGTKVGVISDSVDHLPNLLGDELPSVVTVLPGQSGIPGTSEGTALLEIVHDMAPGAELFFATANGGEAQFAQNILDLAAAGCDIIVDDALYFSEGVFQDGVVAQAVETFFSQGGIYITSAGNSGNLNADESGVWEGDYLAGSLPGPLVGAGLSAHDFGGGVTNNRIALDSQSFFTLQWSDPLSQATNDYDLFLLDNSLSNVVAASTTTQNGTQNPFEIIDTRVRNDLNARLVVVLFDGEPRFIHLNTHRGRLEVGTDGQIFGHPGAENAQTIAAVNVATANGGPFLGGVANPVEFFSSDGPRRIFFNADGSPVEGPLAAKRGGGQTSIVRNKPDFAGADGVMTTTPGFNPFFGTSASAPHIAGLTSLALQAFNGTQAFNFNNLEIIDIFRSTALDIEGPGFDRDSGFGILDAADSLGDPIFFDGFESGNTSSWSN